jgi:hypothetical protein
LTQQIDIDVTTNVDVTNYVDMTIDVKMACHVIFDNLDFKQDMKFHDHNLKFTCVWHGKINGLVYDKRFEPQSNGFCPL